jgi:hypothetical protein
MKVALCLHGYFNSFTDSTSKGEDGFKHLQEHVFSKCDPDVYIHSWDLQNKDIILDLYKDYIVDSHFEEPIDFSDQVKENNLHLLPKTPGYVPPETIFSHMYSIQKSFEFQELKDRDYDVVIKSRFDVGRINRNSTGPGSTNPYPVQCINFDPSLPMDKLYMANWQAEYLKNEGPADMWFYSSKEKMLKFSNIYSIIKRDMVVDPNTHTSDFLHWAGTLSNGMINTIKTFKWFFIKTNLWENKGLLETTWE